MDIIQHHEPFDFAAFFENHESKYINLDLHDFETFIATTGEKHSFIGVSDTDADNRIQNALDKIMAQLPEQAIDSTSDMMIMFIHSPNGPKPLRVDEAHCVNEYISRFPSETNVRWGMDNDDSLGESVKVYLLLNLKR